MDKDTQGELKKETAKVIADKAQTGSVLGVGTGSTVKFFVDWLGERKKKEGLILKRIVTTSSCSRKQLESYGFKVDELADVDEVDLVVGGADRIDSQLNGIKGGGAALTLEKDVAVNSKKNIWIVDESKVTDHLSGFKLPVEVLPVSCMQVKKRLEKEGLNPEFRMNGDQKLTTHYDNYTLDLDVSPIPVPTGLADYLDHTVGVVEHGLFLSICDEVIVAKSNGTIQGVKR